MWMASTARRVVSTVPSSFVLRRRRGKEISFRYSGMICCMTVAVAQLPKARSTQRNHAGQMVVFLTLGHVWGTCPKWFWPETFGDAICLESIVFYSNLLKIMKLFILKNMNFAKMTLCVAKFLGQTHFSLVPQTCPDIRNKTICSAWFFGVD